MQLILVSVLFCFANVLAFEEVGEVAELVVATLLSIESLVVKFEKVDGAERDFVHCHQTGLVGESALLIKND